MSSKSDRMAEFARQFGGRGVDPRYAGYFECFDSGRYYEAHDVLEDLWLEVRREPVGDFYKALIQFAGAFVHMQKERRGPALALLKLSASYLRPFAPERCGLNVAEVLALGAGWEQALSGSSPGPLMELRPAPVLQPFLRIA